MRDDFNRNAILLGLLLALGVAVVLAADGMAWHTLGLRNCLLAAAGAAGLCAAAMLEQLLQARRAISR